MNISLSRDFARLHDGDVGGFSPGRLWSLWDLMHKLRADVFFKAYEQATALHQFLAVRTPPNSQVFGSKVDFQQHVARLGILSEELDAIGMLASSALIKRAAAILEAAPDGDPYNGEERVVISQPDASRLQIALSQATSRIADDFSLHNVLVSEIRKIHYYENAKLFGDDVFNKFQSANEDIAESGTCLSLDRGTACVMHLMRVIEVGLCALAATLGISKQNDWGRYLTPIEQELDKRKKAAGARSPDEQFYAEIAITINNIRVAFRNPTMHPEKTYSVERAEEILISVRSFMRHLATKISE